MNSKLKAQLERASDGLVVFLTGAGMSAESKIPTFRGEEGYWTIGSTNYRTETLATRQAFSQMPDDCWGWYLYRRTVCNRAQPNPGHRLLAKLEQHLGARFLLVTQNVDGLHLRAGNTLEKTYQVHGNTNFMRCWNDCCLSQFPIPDAVGDLERGQSLSDAQRSLLVCPECSGPARPHVLWFDECYDEERYFFQSALYAALRCKVLVSIGSSGSTNLPTQMVRGASAHGAVAIDINPERGTYARLAESSGGFWLEETASEGLRIIAEGLGLES